MVHGHLTQLIGKRLTGKQNILPALRDANEDERTFIVTLDTDAKRVTGELLQVGRSSSDELATVKVEHAVSRTGRQQLATGSIISLRIDSIDGAAWRLLGDPAPTPDTPRR